MTLSGKKAFILAEDLYQELEIWYPLLKWRRETNEPVKADDFFAR